MPEERNLEPHVFIPFCLTLAKFGMGTAVKPHNIKFLKICAAFLTLLPVNNHNKAIRRILKHFVAKAPNHNI